MVLKKFIVLKMKHTFLESFNTHYIPKKICDSYCLIFCEKWVKNYYWQCAHESYLDFISYPFFRCVLIFQTCRDEIFKKWSKKWSKYSEKIRIKNLSVNRVGTQFFSSTLAKSWKCLHLIGWIYIYLQNYRIIYIFI